MTTANIILALSTTTTALIAGLFYGYSCSVNTGLGNLSDTEYLSAMQSINRAILNPLFFMSFMGTLFLLPVSAFLQYKTGNSACFMLLLAASVVYAIGVFGVTIFGNVPLNEALDTFTLQSASIEAIEQQRQHFEVPWNNLHTIRTVASVVALILAIVTCLTKSNV